MSVQYKRKKPHITHVKVCAVCGDEFRTAYSKKVYCDTERGGRVCAEMANSARERAKRVKAAAENKTK